MKIEGTSDIPAPRDRVWAAFLDPAVLVQGDPRLRRSSRRSARASSRR